MTNRLIFKHREALLTTNCVHTPVAHWHTCYEKQIGPKSTQTMGIGCMNTWQALKFVLLGIVPKHLQEHAKKAKAKFDQYPTQK